MTEERFRVRVLQQLRARGGEWITYPRTRFAAAGISDVLGCYRGRFVALELKRPNGEGHYGATRTQEAFIARVRAAGGYAIVASTWEAIEALLLSIDAEEDGVCRRA